MSGTGLTSARSAIAGSTRTLKMLDERDGSASADFGIYRTGKEPIDVNNENHENDFANNTPDAVPVRDFGSAAAIPAAGVPQTDIPHGFQIGQRVSVDRWCCPDGPEGHLPTRHPEKYNGTIKRFGAQLAMIYLERDGGGVGVVHWDDCKAL